MFPRLKMLVRSGCVEWLSLLNSVNSFRNSFSPLNSSCNHRASSRIVACVEQVFRSLQMTRNTESLSAGSRLYCKSIRRPISDGW